MRDTRSLQMGLVDHLFDKTQRAIREGVLLSHGDLELKCEAEHLCDHRRGRLDLYRFCSQRL
uniref:Uncharacterized protein n=1 Tax=Myoviridae sp. ctGBP5 TaxID=2825071 RepID=A0A8S5PA58_9CAUD|nr:MAG TPA: hypothetical protein [Myoviridae sp. ctGBP5]